MDQGDMRGNIGTIQVGQANRHAGFSDIDLALQVGAACGYIAAKVAATLVSHREDGRWLSEIECRCHTDLAVVREGNQVLGINLQSPEETTYLAESQVERLVLHHLQTGDAPLPAGVNTSTALRNLCAATTACSLDLFVRGMADDVGRARKTSKPQVWQARIVNSSPCTETGFHWIVVAYQIRPRTDNDHTAIGRITKLGKLPGLECARQEVTAWLVISQLNASSQLKVGSRSALHTLYEEWGAATVKVMQRGPEGAQSKVLCVCGTFASLESFLPRALSNHEHSAQWTRLADDAKRSRMCNKSYLLTREEQPVLSKKSPFTLVFMNTALLQDTDKHTSTFILESLDDAKAVAKMFGLASDFGDGEQERGGSASRTTEDKASNGKCPPLHPTTHAHPPAQSCTTLSFLPPTQPNPHSETPIIQPTNHSTHALTQSHTRTQSPSTFLPPRSPKGGWLSYTTR